MQTKDMSRRMRIDLAEAGVSDEELKALSPYECFARWLEWNGIIAWSTSIYEAAIACHNAGGSYASHS